ncbi:hypothetical protein ACE3J1_17980 [Enterobacter hormaechei subsp. steigerwaltii]
MNNKELVNAGHELAKAISNDTPLIEIAKMVSNLATQLDVQLARSNALAAENAGLKSKLIFWDWNDPEMSYDSPEELAEAFSLNYNEEFTVMVAAKMPNRVYRVCESWEQECKVELVDGGEFETPDTDAFLAEVRAQGVEMFAAYCGEENSVFVEAKAYYRSLPDAAYEFAAQLRKGEQS